MSFFDRVGGWMVWEEGEPDGEVVPEPDGVVVPEPE